MYSQRKPNKEIEELIRYSSIIKQDGIKPLLARLLGQRKIEDIDCFLNPKQDAYLHLKNLSLVKNIKEVSNLLIEASKKNLVISISSDFDADGIVSAYMVKRICEILKIECNVFLPSRFEQGYGLNKETLGAFLDFTFTNKTPDVLLVLDCGSSSEKQIQELKGPIFNIKTIAIIDHHIIKEENFSQSSNVVVNWRINNAQEMCTCGLVYLVALDMFATHKILTIDNIQELLFLAAIGTITDVNPITGDNRIIVKQGLQFFDKLTSEGLIDLINLCKKDNKVITQSQIAFQLGPKLNAGGRINSPQDTFDLLVSKDKDEIVDLLQIIETNNENRKKIQSEILKEAIAMIDKKKLQCGIFLVNPKWNVGVVGIVAQKIAEKFNRPTVIIGRGRGVLKGSGRSIEKISLIKILDGCQEMFVKYGGHDNAAGMTLKKNFLDKSNKMFNNACQKVYEEANVVPGDKETFWDASLRPVTVNEETYEIVKLLYPYCKTNNPEPLFILEGVNISLLDKKEGKNGKLWKMFKFEVEGIGYKFITFDEEVGQCVNEKTKANVYFQFSQDEKSKWGMKDLNIVGIDVLEILNNGTMPVIKSG